MVFGACIGGLQCARVGCGVAMKHGLHATWCSTCARMSLMGGPVAVARHLGVDRQTVRRWRRDGQVHAWELSSNHWIVCACSTCGTPWGSQRCELCRKKNGNNGDKWDIGMLDEMR
jgi:hypothetical protein